MAERADWATSLSWSTISWPQWQKPCRCWTPPLPPALVAMVLVYDDDGGAGAEGADADHVVGSSCLGSSCWYCCRSSHQCFEIGTTSTTTATTHTATLRPPSRHSVRRLATTTRPRRRLFGRIKRPFVRLLSRQRHSSKCSWWCHSDCTAAATAATNVTHGGQVSIGGAHNAGCASIGRPFGHGVRGANRSSQQGWIGRHCCSTGSIGCIIRGWRWRRRTC
jgi:hypothetical protein